jgi:hypothetical protein
MKTKRLEIFGRLLGAILIIAPLSYINAADHPRYMKVETGGSPLVMRESPDRQGRPLGNIPDSTIVAFVEETGNEVEIAGKKGKWTKISWETKTGWVFGGFLSEVPMGAPEGSTPEGSQEVPVAKKTKVTGNSDSSGSFVLPLFLILIIASSTAIYVQAKKKGKLNLRGTSIVPLIMGIIGAVIQLPGALCAGMCAGGVSSALSGGSKSLDATMAGVEATGLFLGIGLLAALIGFIAGLFGKKSPVFSGIGLLCATLLTMLLSIMTFNIFSLIAFILFLIGSIFAFVQKKEPA